MSGPTDSKYLNIFSWGGSRDPSPKAPEGQRADDTASTAGPAAGAHPDHKVSQRHRLSLAKQPRDLPRLDVRWFHAVDVAKSKPTFISKKDEKPVKPKKWNGELSCCPSHIYRRLTTPSAFTSKDSRSIETKFLQTTEDEEREELLSESTGAPKRTSPKSHPEDKVSVSEDYLFEVDIRMRELAPVYWEGSIFEVRRGTWFDASTGAPTEENLAMQLEDGFVKNAPWRRSETAGKEGAVPVVHSHRLFGPYMNQTATYTGSTTAWILSDDFLSKVSGAMLQRFVGGAGTKYIRGYSETLKKKGDAKSSEAAALKDGAVVDENQTNEKVTEEPKSPKLRSLERQVSNIAGRASQEAEAEAAEDERLRQEAEMLQDYQDEPGERQDREVDHLILVTHGIGQRLGARFESFDFVHDVNQLRKTIKSSYRTFPDLQALNGDIGNVNSRVQVLPISWRHKLKVPLEQVADKQHDITDQDSEEDFPGLADLTLEGVPALRNIISDLALDVLLYSTPAYKERISRIVVQECNRILSLYKKRTGFNGQVSFLGHSLGSAIMLDILCAQPDDTPSFTFERHSRRPDHDLRLRFDVDHFYALGSPIGLFQMLKGQKIAGRKNPNMVTLDGSSDDLEDKLTDRLPVDALAGASSPKCKQLFNVFHPSDPIAYRLEPLVSQSMSSIKPQLLPSTKKNFFSAPMGQFSGLWSTFSTGITNSFITRSLGLTAEDAARLGAPAEQAQGAQAAQQLAPNQANPSAGAGTNISGGVVPDSSNNAAMATAREVQKSVQTGDDVVPPTLIDDDLETLYSGFLKRKLQGDIGSRDLGDNALWAEAEERGRRLRREEAKVRALNTTGRIDFALRESAFEISWVSSLASHLTYWNETDVAHFMTSQLLSRSRKTRPR